MCTFICVHVCICVYLCVHEHFHTAYMYKVKFLFFHQRIAANLFYTRQQVDPIQSVSHVSPFKPNMKHRLLPTRGCVYLYPNLPFILSVPTLATLRPWAFLSPGLWTAVSFFWPSSLRPNGSESEERCWISAATWPCCLAPPPDLIVSICVHACCLQCFERVCPGMFLRQTELAGAQVQCSHQGTSENLL